MCGAGSDAPQQVIGAGGDDIILALGVPEFVRHAVRFYLRLFEEMEIRRQYQKGYGEANLTALALEMKDWEEEQVWPEP